MGFESDLEELRASPLAVPSAEMRIRHERRASSSASPAQLLTADSAARYQVVALYDPTAVKGSKPIVVVEVNPLADIEHIEQGAVITVRGWPVVGRAVVLDIDGVVVEPTYPCVSPDFRPMRFK